MNLSPGKEIPMMLAGGSEDDRDRLARLESLIVPLAKLTEVTFLVQLIRFQLIQLIGRLEVHVPISGLIDVEAEVARLEKQLEEA